MNRPHDNQDGFGWIDEGRRSEGCRRSSRRVLRLAAPALLAWFSFVAGVVLARAFAPAIGLSAAAWQYPLLFGVLLGIAALVGFVLGWSAGRGARCSACTAIAKASATAREHTRRVRAGGPPPCSYSSDHPERMLSSLHRRVQPPTGDN